MIQRRLAWLDIRRVNLCSGSQSPQGYFGIDLLPGCDLQLDLARNNLPFNDASLEAVVCMSAINYFDRRRAEELICETFRVLRCGGICRMGVQDMRILAERYIKNDTEFFFQKLPDGRARFDGPTIGDKFAAWFYGYAIMGRPCKYFYDYDSLAYLFETAGFTIVEQKQFRESRLKDIELIDNRPDQMFFLEAVK